MIWYLLYPFRGTTEPPVLQPNHPLRRTFSRYGREAARHPVITLLISVALAVILIYPFPYLYTNNFTNGSSNLPHHVWTAAQPYEGTTKALPDVVMRTVWVHGSYMDALNRSVLLSALEIQDRLLGPTTDFNPTIVPKQLKLDPHASVLTREERDSLHAVNGISGEAWFFHSPLLYWSGSSQAIADDMDIIGTVNEGSKKATFVNVTLRHSIVFSGKRFEDRRLVAADALVITLIHKLDSPVGRQWERQSEAIARDNSRWRVYPHDGKVLASQLYEFKFQPLSFQDDLFLGIAYALTLCYFLISLTKLRALKSRTGLTLTVITQIAVSIMSSFTICAVFKIDLSKIPREAYPLVVLTIGLENIFRLINAVIVTPSENSTSSRIAEALGQTGPIALAGVTQNLFLLWLLAKVVAPSVASFCVFAAIALIFDFCYLLTFFVAVLGVDVRRTELSDSLDRAGRRPVYERLGVEGSIKQSWADAYLFGRVPVSTRIAGTVVMVGFVLIAQWHFFESEHPTRTLSRLIQLLLLDHKPAPSMATHLSIDVNQARSPMQWLRLQDHETAREVIQVVRPGSHSYIARVYEPLVIVLDGSNRAPNRQGIRPFLPAVYDFARHQSTPFVMTILFVVAAISLLMNYLLWGEEDIVEDDDDEDHKDGPLLRVKTLARGHALDIAMIEASPAGVVVSVGLDRWIRVWDIRRELVSYMIDTRNLEPDTFPLSQIAVDDTANWIALLSMKGKIMLWNIPLRRWGPSITVEMNGRKPVLFTFRIIKADTIASLVLVRSSGLLTEVIFTPDELPDLRSLQVCKTPLIYVRQFWDNALSTATFSQLATASRRGCVHIAYCADGQWISEDVDLCWPEGDKEVSAVIPLPALRSFLSVRRYAVDLIDLQTRTILHTFGPIISHQNTLKCFHTTKRKPNNGPTGITSFSMIYTDRESGDCVVRTYTPRKEGEFMCIGRKKCSDDSTTCCSWKDAVEQTHRMECPGQWEALPCGVAVGVRRCLSQRPSSSGSQSNGTAFPYSTLRRRASPLDRSPQLKEEEEDTWETWMLSATGEKIVIPMADDESNSEGRHLFATSCGPIARVGRRSVAVGLGNVIKVITVGNERFDGADDSTEDMTAAIASRRRKFITSRKKSYNPYS